MRTFFFCGFLRRRSSPEEPLLLDDELELELLEDELALRFFLAMVVTRALPDVTERALQITADRGRRCGGWASGVLGVVDRWLSGPASHSSA